MKKVFIFLILTLSILAQTITGVVVSVHDGDTITVEQNNQKYKIRFNKIDAPELKQSYGDKSQKFLSGLILNKTVKVEVQDTDKYGRFVSDVYLDKVWINAKMVENGYAWNYTQYSKDLDLIKLEAQAKDKKVGLWAEKNPTAPWDYRHGTSTTSTTTKTTSEKKTSKVDTKESVVYVTKTGKKYHRSGCSSLAKSKIEISKSDAIAEGYEPCKKCNP